MSGMGDEIYTCKRFPVIEIVCERKRLHRYTTTHSVANVVLMSKKRNEKLCDQTYEICAIGS